MNLKRNCCPNASLSQHIQYNLNPIFLVYKYTYGHKLVLFRFLCVVEFNSYPKRTRASTCHSIIYPPTVSIPIVVEKHYAEEHFVSHSWYFCIRSCVAPHKVQQIKLSDIYKNFLAVLFSLSHFILICLDSKGCNNSLYFSFINS